MTDKPAKPTVTLVRSSYQPSKVELEEPIEFPEGRTPEDLAKAVMRTVMINKKAKPE